MHFIKQKQFGFNVKMGSKFEKNNIISDSESDCESPHKFPESLCDSTPEQFPSSRDSEKSVIEDSLLDISEIQSVSLRKNIVEESIIEDSSAYGETNISIDDVSHKSGISGSSVEFVASLSTNNLIEQITSSSEEDNDVQFVPKAQRDYVIEESFEKSKNSSLDSYVKEFERNTSDGQVISESDTNESHDSLQKTGSSLHSEHSILERQIAEKTTVYHCIMKAVNTCNPKKLKDGGKLLQEKLMKCKEELDELKEKLKNLPKVPDDSPVLIHSKIHSRAIFSSSDQNVRNFGKKRLETHRVEAALTADALVTIHESLTTCPSENTFEKEPRGLRVELMPHQKYALAWLLWREKQIPPAGILADDMGLGKTLSILSLILRSEELKKEKCKEEPEEAVIRDSTRTYEGKTLVVCPASLVGQWEEQSKKHFKNNILTMTIHHGRTREVQPKRLVGYDVVITTYGILSEENKCSSDGKKGALFRIRWERIVLDEAHIIRNHKTQKAVAACELSGTYRWCLTGTPVHNRELDIYSLLKFMRCSPFDDYNVWKRWVENKSANGVQRLKTVMKSILLRRTKEELTKQGQLQDLPNKDFIPVYIELDKEELKVYHEVLTYSRTLLAEYLRQKELRSECSNENLEKIRNHLKGMEDLKTTDVFVLLLRLRQLCCIPGLIHSFLEKETCVESGIEPDDPVVEDLYTQLSRISISGPKQMKEVYDRERIKNVLHKSNPVFDLDRPSTKIQALLNILNDVLSTGDKIVIVSQWTGVLKKLEPHIRKLNVKMVCLDGGVPVKSRSKIIDEFNQEGNNTRVMLLSLNAGGVGLNLIGGNRLVIFEPHWNPQLESQACDRIYRVGQKKHVYIYKILCKDTIEEKIELLQKQKLELANNILSEGDRKTLLSQLKQLTLNDLATLFEV